MDKSTLMYILTAGVAICAGGLCIQYFASTFTEEYREEEIEDRVDKIISK
ncbi:hypothetical protein [Priestia taiwanensis]|uniref:Uncharacterized protein n=1 Tax=Priestia taiwanensis TaxID=1347902 RepID=A0A917ETI6_9BACI|nr:hypothetical protein [Priestia taiwanensis]MBM7364710.1 hypothetical protein [Priestia taiwanensis]GGE79039.1 hypothetical protein GCM10007140_30740 [Priestia taiwanensis]